MGRHNGVDGVEFERHFPCISPAMDEMAILGSLSGPQIRTGLTPTLVVCICD